MLRKVPDGLWTAFEQRMENDGVPKHERHLYCKWLRYFFDFTKKYQHPVIGRESVAPFRAKLASKNQSVEQCGQAEQAVNLYHAMVAEKRRSNTAGAQAESGIPIHKSERRPDSSRSSIAAAAASFPAQTKSGGASWEGPFDGLQGAIRLRNYSPKTLDAYQMWVRQFQAFVRSKPIAELDTADVKAFLTDLAVRKKVSASSQNQAFNALLFFYRRVLGKEFGKLDGVVRPKRRPYVPVVLSRVEVDAVLAGLEPPYRLIVMLLYGCGLRLGKCVGLRIHNFNLDAMILTVHDGKGQKDRTVPLPAAARAEVQAGFDTVGRLHAEDLAAGYGGVFLPRQLERKYRNAAKEMVWQWLFPAVRLTTVKETGEQRRYHIHEEQVQQAVKRAAMAAGILKRVSPHTFRHSFASHLLQANYDLQTIQKLLGHGDVKTTMIYVQTVPSVTLKEAKSPLDLAIAEGGKSLK